MKTIILAAGYGARLKSITEHTPKPMLPLAGKPLLYYTLRYLRHYGFTDIAINLHFCPDKITSYLGNGKEFGVKIYYSYESEPLGTAGAIGQLQNYLSKEEDFLVIYGDLLISQNLHDITQFHKKKKAAATIGLFQDPNENSLVNMDQTNRITGFIERPTDQQRKLFPFPWVNAGVQLLNRRLLSYIPTDRPSDLPRDIYVPLYSREIFYGFPLAGYRSTIDTPALYRKVSQDIYSCPKIFGDFLCH